MKSINVAGNDLQLDCKGHFSLAIAFYSTKARLRSGAGDEIKAKEYLDTAFKLSEAKAKFLSK